MFQSQLPLIQFRIISEGLDDTDPTYWIRYVAVEDWQGEQIGLLVERFSLVEMVEASTRRLEELFGLGDDNAAR